jgi:glycosyltransferase involved in cell wall biosynthesis
MRVLQIYKDYYPPVKGGIEKHLNLLTNGLLDRGVQVEVLVSNTRLKMEIDHFNGFPIYKVPQLGRISSAPLNVTLPFWIRKLGAKADILHFHFPNPTSEAAYLISGLKKKVVVTYHSDIIRQVYLKKFYEPLMHCFLNRANRIIATSQKYVETSQTLINYKEKCEVIPLGINIDQFNINSRNDRMEKVGRIRRKHELPLILFVGRFRYYKGVHVLIQAMRNIDAKLLIAGPELESGDIKKVIAEAGVRHKIDVLGELSDDMLSDYLHACDIFALPSVKRSEAFGIVQLEAMACAKPVVCTEIGTGTSFVNIHEKTGLVVPPNNPDALAKAINLLLKNPATAKQYGENGLARVNAFFSSDKMIRSTESLYRKILHQATVSKLTHGYSS